MNARRATICAVLAVAGLVGFAVQSSAQVKKGKTRPLTTKQLMNSLVKPRTTALGEALKTTPADDKAWEAAITEAALLNESAHVMMADDRCPDETWANACKLMEKSAQEVVAKLEARDLAAAQAAYAGVTKSCGACHVAHKK
ncbi:MAG: hypothetical protein ACK47B_23415 [Armatimonadota bacterium]